MYKTDILLAPLCVAACSYALYKIVRDIVSMEENRPTVTDQMIEQAYERDIMLKSDEEMAEMDWLADDDD